ncbi:hypothetical protein VTN96DRAFT_727 [Rasamsonia emersonii]
MAHAKDETPAYPDLSLYSQNVITNTQAEALRFPFNGYYETFIPGVSIYHTQIKTCRDALFLTDPEIDRQELISIKGPRVSGTCEWIRENELYRSWLDSGTQLLWITGSPGKGKTMLSLFLTEELERRTQGMENSELIFHFCRHQDEKRGTAVAILRGLLYHPNQNCHEASQSHRTCVSIFRIYRKNQSDNLISSESLDLIHQSCERS